MKKNRLSLEKRETILGEYKKIKQVQQFRSKFNQDNNNRKNTILRDLINDLNQNITPYVNNDYFDILGEFYTQFIRYAGSDKKTGLVLTPTHICELFCELAELNENDKVFDPCCGTGGFLVSAMKYMIDKSGNDLKKHSKIKGNQLIGIESRPDMFSHACSNMMMRGDGKSHIHHGNCFDKNLKKSVKDERPNNVFLNPPYDHGPDRQLEFIENAMDCIIPKGICIAICQFSTVVSSEPSTVKIRKRIFEKHTLEAVLSMPNSLFHPIGVVTAILIFKTHNPHSDQKETFFGYFKKDGFLKVKNKGRIDQNCKWESIKKKWLDAYINQKNIAGLSIMKTVKPNDECCAEAYIETDYSKISKFDFIETIKSSLIPKFLYENKPLYEISVLKNKNSLNINQWKLFKIIDLFDIYKGERIIKKNRIDGDTALITATSNYNGIVSRLSKMHHEHEKKIFKNTITIDMFFNSFYHGYEYFSDDNVHTLISKDNLNKYTLLFICSVIKIEEFKYDYGRQVRINRLKKVKIKLPIDQFNNPNYKFMEEYIKSLPYSSNL